MKNIKTIGLLALLCTFSLFSSSSEQSDQFQPHTTDEFIYTIATVERPMQAGDVQFNTPVIISDTIKNNYFNSGIVRTKISESTQDDVIITSTETWATKNPSYLTWTNAALISGLVATGAFGYLYQIDAPKEWEKIKQEPSYKSFQDLMKSKEEQNQRIHDTLETAISNDLQQHVHDKFLLPEDLEYASNWKSDETSFKSSPTIFNGIMDNNKSLMSFGSKLSKNNSQTNKNSEKIQDKITSNDKKIDDNIKNRVYREHGWDNRYFNGQTTKFDDTMVRSMMNIQDPTDAQIEQFQQQEIDKIDNLNLLENYHTGHMLHRPEEDVLNWNNEIQRNQNK